MSEASSATGPNLADLELDLGRRLEALETSSPVTKDRRKVRAKAKETLEAETHVQSDVQRQITHLRFCLKLLRNLRLNQGIFEGGSLQLRINQLRGLQKLAEFLLKTEGLSGYFRQPTGSGKTVLFGIIARLLSVPTLILVPRTNLLTQTVQELTNIVGFDASEIGIVGGGEIVLGRTITVATYQSHLTRLESDPDYRATVGRCELIICDEAHRSLGGATAASVRLAHGEVDDEESEELLIDAPDAELTEAEETAEQEVFASLQTWSRPALKLGFTATPELASKAVGDHFGPCIASERHSDMIAAGICVPYELTRVDGTVSELDLDGPMTEEKEAGILKREGTYSKLVEAYSQALTTYRATQTERSYPLRGVAFCVNIDECDVFAGEAVAQGLRCRIVTGREASGKEGPAVITQAEQDLLEGTIDLIVTVKKLAEGWNFPPANAAIWARACTSAADVVQGIGRTARAYSDQNYGPKAVSHVFETRFEVNITTSRRRTRRPLGIADALLRNGEEPTLICTNGDGSPVEFLSPPTREEAETDIRTRLTPKMWATMSTKDKRFFRLSSQPLGLIAIARLFNKEGDPINNPIAHLSLGRGIWGDEWVEPETLDDAALRTFITQAFSPAQWAGMKHKQRSALKLGPDKLGLNAVARLFGIMGDPLKHHASHIALGRVIWRDEWIEPKEVMRTTITETFTPTEWAELKQHTRAALKLGPESLGLAAITTLFGVEGDAVDNQTTHLCLGRAIWGEKWIDPKDALRSLISQSYSPEQWAEMDKVARKALRVGPQLLGLKAIATFFDIKDDPVSHPIAHLSLGRAIWGESWVEPVDTLRALIAEAYSPEKWARMKRGDKKALKLGPQSFGLVAVARFFGVKGNPIDTTSIHLALGRAIWPNSEVWHELVS